MPIDDHEKQVFDAAPVTTQLSILYIQSEKIFDQLRRHPINCDDRFTTIEKRVKKLSRWKIVDSVVAITTTIGVSIGFILAYIKGWIAFYPKE